MFLRRAEFGRNVVLPWGSQNFDKGWGGQKEGWWFMNGLYYPFSNMHSLLSSVICHLQCVLINACTYDGLFY